jgi:hypothetical protein
MELVEQEGTDLNDFVSTAKYVHILPACSLASAAV